MDVEYRELTILLQVYEITTDDIVEGKNNQVLDMPGECIDIYFGTQNQQYCFAFYFEFHL